MGRLTRIESQASTREKLLEAATRLFRRDGYAMTSLERIAEDAGFSKGAVYSNFDGKEAIFLAVLDTQGRGRMDTLLAAIDVALDRGAIVDLLARWADDCSRSGGWSLTLVEHARAAGAGSSSLDRQIEIITDHWQKLGERVLARLPDISSDAMTLGALLHEIAYAPAMTFVRRLTAGDLIRLALARD